MTDGKCIFKTSGTVVLGFGRGARELGIPTANLDDSVIEDLPSSMSPGVYAGWAQVGDGEVYKMVMSLGWNPFYKNEKKSLEVHVLHTFPEDFYGKRLTIVVLRYLRPELDFESPDDLIRAIHKDISMTEEILDSPECLRYSKDEIFQH
ncbi:riboflavin kinase [Echinococcus multilocularis]|uniref:riboflavin kinase n=1 Tax=Echinococcus multilocularis TaxID=6211 RepID=A0A068YG05_ECHMU|nr:riboflavin kinase [Echinococcus multilocularis]